MPEFISDGVYGIRTLQGYGNDSSLQCLAPPEDGKNGGRLSLTTIKMH